jgi:hypothetical protein
MLLGVSEVFASDRSELGEGTCCLLFGIYGAVVCSRHRAGSGWAGVCIHSLGEGIARSWGKAEVGRGTAAVVIKC